MITEADIAYETADGVAWVWRDRKLSRYVVLRSGLVASTSDSAYPLDDDGLSLAKARADYLSRRHRPIPPPPTCSAPAPSPEAALPPSPSRPTSDMGEGTPNSSHTIHTKAVDIGGAATDTSINRSRT